MSGKKGGDATNYAVAAQYNLDKDAFYKARLLDSGEAAFSYTQVCESCSYGTCSCSRVLCICVELDFLAGCVQAEWSMTCCGLKTLYDAYGKNPFFRLFNAKY
jgi:hypothetical protein